MAIILILFVSLVPFVTSDLSDCPSRAKKESNFNSKFVANKHVVSIVNNTQRKLSLITGVPYFLLNEDHQYRTFYGGNGYNRMLWTRNEDVNGKHMQWDLMETEELGYYEIRRGIDDRVLTCFRGQSHVVLGIGVLSKDISLWSIEESTTKPGYFNIRCKATPDRLLNYNQTNQLINNVNDKNILWQFLPAYRLEDYHIRFQIHKVKYPLELDDLLENERQTVAISESVTIPNYSPATLQHSVSYSRTVTETQSMTLEQSFSQGRQLSSHTSSSIQHSQLQTYGIQVADTNTDSNTYEASLEVEAGFSFFGAEVKTKAGFRYSHTDEHQHQETETSQEEDATVSDSEWGSEAANSVDNSNSRGMAHEQSVSTTYSIDEVIEVPPFKAVKINSYIDFINNFTTPFKVIVYVTMESVRTLKTFYGCRKNSKGERKCKYNARLDQMDADAVEWFLKQYNSDIAMKIVGKCDKIVLVEVHGSMTGSYGIKSVFVAEEVPIDMRLVNRTR